MSSSLKLQQATHGLAAALKLAQAERDQALVELARGQRSQRELQRLCERAALLANLLLQARALLPPPALSQCQAQSQAQSHGQPQPPPCNGWFRPGEHWQRGQVRYRVESCPLIPSCVRLWPTAGLPETPLHRHPGNTTHFRRISP
jgi:hypothetical protein